MGHDSDSFSSKAHLAHLTDVRHNSVEVSVATFEGSIGVQIITFTACQNLAHQKIKPARRPVLIQDKRFLLDERISNLESDSLRVVRLLRPGKRAS